VDVGRALSPTAGRARAQATTGVPACAAAWPIVSMSKIVTSAVASAIASAASVGHRPCLAQARASAASTSSISRTRSPTPPCAAAGEQRAECPVHGRRPEQKHRFLRARGGYQDGNRW
jgi:hypothetical protein